MGIQKAKEKVKEWDDNAVGSACGQTSYPMTCNETFAGNDHPRDTNGVTRFSVQRAEGGVNDTQATVNGLNSTDPDIAGPYAICTEQLASATEELQNAAAALDTLDNVDETTLDDVKTWVSAAMEMHTTCIDAYKEVLTDLLFQPFRSGRDNLLNA